MLLQVVLGLNFGTSQGIGFSLIFRWLYYSSFEKSSWQATPGKRFMGLRVVTLEGGRIDQGQANVRFLASLLSGLLLCYGYLRILWDDNAQGLHDRLAGTLVVDTRG